MPGETIREIGQQYNYDNVYFRMVTVALGKVLNKSIRWINYFTGEKRCITLPFNYRMFGQERFLLDSYLDDIVDRRVELNTDQIPRGVISLTSFNSVSDEFANPNIYIPKDCKIRNEWKRIITKVKAIPMQMNYDVEIMLDDQRDVWICSEKIIMLYFNYYFFNMDYYGLKLDIVLQLPDDKTVEVPSEGDFTSDKKKSIKFALTVRSYYPIWTVDTDNVECYNEEFENIKRVYWQSYVHDYQKLRDLVVPENVNDPDFQASDPRTTTSIEDFSVTPSFYADNPNYDKTGNVSTTNDTPAYAPIPATKWTYLNDNLATKEIISFITVGNRVIAGTNNGIYYNDHLINGNFWTVSNSGLGFVYDLMIDSYNNIYAGTNSGLYTSIDSGNTWSGLYSGFTGKDIYTIINSNTDLLVGSDDGVYISTDSGLTWTLKNNGLKSAVYSLGSINGNLYAGVNGGIYISTNNGNSWSSILGKPGKNVLIVGGTDIVVANDASGIYVSELSSINWEASTGLKNPYVISLSEYDGQMYAGTVEGLYQSDNGRNWDIVDVMNNQIMSELVFNGYIFAGTNKGIYKYKI